jgi:hypothetical protein
MRLRLALPLLMLAGLLLLGVTCRHEIVTPEPIKIEVTIREEIHHYTHQVNEAVAGNVPVEDVVNDILAEPPASGGSSLLQGVEELFIGSAYAADDETRARLTAAIEGRRGRHGTVQQYLKDGSVGENHNATLSFRETAKTQADANYAKAVRDTIAVENADRETIISIIAAHRGVAVSIVREEQFKANVNAAPGGAWVEVQQNNKWVWSQK